MVYDPKRFYVAVEFRVTAMTEDEAREGVQEFLDGAGGLEGIEGVAAIVAVEQERGDGAQSQPI